MNLKQQFAERDIDVRRYEYDDSVVLAADLGYTGSGSVDLVGDTVMIVTDGEQLDVEVEGAAQAFIKNGVLTIEVDT